jgi:hypothetical protein
MNTFTIHALGPAVEKQIRAKARKDGKSLNQTLKELLAASVGVTPKPAAEAQTDFAEFCGIWSAKEAAAFQAATADLETVDKADWQ